MAREIDLLDKTLAVDRRPSALSKQINLMYLLVMALYESIHV